MNLKDDLSVQEKFLKVKNFSSSNRKVDKDDKEDVVTITYKKNLLIVLDLWQFYYQNFVDNLAEGICKVKCKNCNCFLGCANSNCFLV